MMAQKCEANKTNGEPCQNHAIEGSNVCRVHGGSAPQVKRKAKERLNEAAGGAAETLIDLKEKLQTIIEEQDLTPSEVKSLASEARQQATEILDRADKKGAPKVSKKEITGEDGGPIKLKHEDLQDMTDEELEALRKAQQHINDE